MEELLGDIELKDKNFIPIFCSKHRKDGYKNFAKKQSEEAKEAKPKSEKQAAVTAKNLLEVGQGVSLDVINQAK